jgi:hypothetical protein
MTSGMERHGFAAVVGEHRPAVIPFVRFFGSRLTGGAISRSPTGALFGALWFWAVAGWWLLFLGSIFAFFGGGVYYFFKLRGMVKRAQADAASLPAPVRANYLVPA